MSFRRGPPPAHGVPLAVLLLLAGSLAHAGEDTSSAAAMLAGAQAERLDAELVRYELIRDTGGWEATPAIPALTAGARHPNTRILRRRLQLTGDYRGEMGADPERFGAPLTEALQKFQRRQGLRINGQLDAPTLQLLNIPVEARIAQLQQARAAWAALPERSAERRVWVNIPEAEVVAIEGNEVRLRMRAVVGHPTRPTPALTSEIRRVIVNPSWTVPVSIAGQDLLPRQLSDPDYLAERDIRVYAGWSDEAPELDPAQVPWDRIDGARFPYRLRQDPGPNNALGHYKFEFPNAFDIYLHDTPSRALLDLSVRSLSSGCVRLQDSAGLARWLANDFAVEIEQAAADSAWRTRSFPVHAAVPIDIVYLSAWVAPESGELQFRRDVYRQAQLSVTQQ